MDDQDSEEDKKYDPALLLPPPLKKVLSAEGKKLLIQSMAIIDEDNNENNNEKTVVKKKKKKSKKRCWFDGCRTKLKLTDMECKCKHKFCGKHRMMESHDCEYLKMTSPKTQYKKRGKMEGLGGGNFKKIDKF